MIRQQTTTHSRGFISRPPPMRVAFVSEHASPLALLGGKDGGGQNVYVDQVARHIAQMGVAVDIFTRRDSTALPEVVQLAPYVRVVHIEAGPAEPVDKDQLWPFMPAFCNSMLNFVLRERVQYDVAHGHFWMSGWVVAQLRRHLSIPTVQLFHALGAAKQRHQGSADTSPDIRIGVEREVIAAVERVIVQCPAEQDELIQDYGADSHKLVQIPAAVNTAMFAPMSQAEARRRSGIEESQPTIVYVGRVLPRKGIRNIVQALALLTREHEWPVPPQLVIVGGATPEPDPVATPEIGAIHELAAELGVETQVHCLGCRPPEELREYYCAADVVATTPWYEPFGLTPLEAMACGRPVVGSDVGGISFTIQDGVTGFLVPPHDPAGLAARLHLLLTNPQLRDSMSRAARQSVEREFTWSIVAERTVALYETLFAPRAAVVGDRVTG